MKKNATRKEENAAQPVSHPEDHGYIRNKNEAANENIDEDNTAAKQDHSSTTGSEITDGEDA